MYEFGDLRSALVERNVLRVNDILQHNEGHTWNQMFQYACKALGFVPFDIHSSPRNDHSSTCVWAMDIRPSQGTLIKFRDTRRAKDGRFILNHYTEIYTQSGSFSFPAGCSLDEAVSSIRLQYGCKVKKSGIFIFADSHNVNVYSLGEWNGSRSAATKPMTYWLPTGDIPQRKGSLFGRIDYPELVLMRSWFYGVIEPMCERYWFGVDSGLPDQFRPILPAMRAVVEEFRIQAIKGITPRKGLLENLGGKLFEIGAPEMFETNQYKLESSVQPNPQAAIAYALTNRDIKKSAEYIYANFDKYSVENMLLKQICKDVNLRFSEDMLQEVE